MTDAETVIVAIVLISAWCMFLIHKTATANQNERRELYSRLMAANLADFTASENQVKPKGRNGIKKRLDEFNSRHFSRKT